MEISNIETVLLSWEMDEPLEYPPSRMYSWDNALIRVETDDGYVGWGEAYVSNSPHTSAEAVPGFVDMKARHLEGRELMDIQLAGVGGGSGLCGRVNGGIEIALSDIVAQHLEIPLYKLLGGGLGKARVYGSGGLGASIEQRVDQAREFAGRGFDLIKIRSFHEPAPTIDLVERTLEVLDDDVRIALDAGPLSNHVKDAIRVGNVLDEHVDRIAWYEDPCDPDNIAAFRRVRDALSVTVSGMESRTGRIEFRDVLEAEAVDMIHPEATIAGGLRELQHISAHAAMHDVPVVTHVWGGAVGLLANLHVAAAEPNCEYVEYCQFDNPLREEFLPDGLERDGDMVRLPVEPGLGIDIPPDVEERYPFEPPRPDGP